MRRDIYANPRHLSFRSTYIRVAWLVGIIPCAWTFLAFDFAPTVSQDSTAILKIYQRGGYGRSGFSLTINGQQITKLKGRTWFEVQVPEGKLSLETVPAFRYPSYEGKSFILEVEKGKVYYLEGVYDHEFMVSRMFLVQRDSARAMRYMNRFKRDEKAKSKLE